MAANKIMNIVFVVLLISALGGTIFGSSGLSDTNFTSAAPAWVVTILTVATGIALVRALMRSA